MSFIKPSCSPIRNIAVISKRSAAVHFWMEEIKFLKLVPSTHYNIKKNCIKWKEITKEETLIAHLK